MDKLTTLVRFKDFSETKDLQKIISEEGRRKETEILHEQLEFNSDFHYTYRSENGVINDISSTSEIKDILSSLDKQHRINNLESMFNIVKYSIKSYNEQRSDSYYNQVEEFHGIVDSVDEKKHSFNALLYNIKTPQKKFYVKFNFEDIQYESDIDLLNIGAPIVWIFGIETQLLLRDGQLKLGPKTKFSKITFRRTKTLSKRQMREAEENAEYWTEFFKGCQSTDKT